MSHFTTIKVQIKNGELLHQVLEELGYQVECNVQVRGYRGDKTNAEYVIRQSNGYDLGFRRSGEDYDWWQIFGALELTSRILSIQLVKNTRAKV
jgi:hypothetical protein